MITPEMVRTVGMSVVAGIIALTVCYVVISEPENTSLQALIAFGGVGLGYLAGKNT